MSIELILLMSLVVLFAFLIKGITGFGEGLIMVTILSLFLDLKYILPVTLIIVLTADLYLLFNFWKEIDKKSIFTIFITAIIGVILGTFFLKNLDEIILKKLLGIFVSLFSIKLLFFDKSKNTIQKKNTIFGVIAGFFGGFIDAIIGTGGPPIVMYLKYIKLKKGVFRATCVMTFFIFHIMRLITYIYSGIITPEVVKTSFMLVPAMLVGSIIGMKIHVKINENLFNKIIAGILLIISITLII